MANRRPKIIVLMAVYRGAAWLEEQIDTILGQEDVDVELYISIDKSGDGSEEICSEAVKNNHTVHLISEDGVFGNAAANFFHLLSKVDLSNCDYISLADQDDIWLPKKLISGVKMLQEHGASGYSSNLLAFWPDGKEYIVEKSQPYQPYDHFYESASAGCTYVLTKPLGMDVQNFLCSQDVNLMAMVNHDWFIYAYARCHGYKWSFDSEYYIRYRQHHNNAVGVNRGVRAFRKRIFPLVFGWYNKSQKIIVELLEPSRKVTFFQALRQWRSFRRRGWHAALISMLVAVGVLR